MVKRTHSSYDNSFNSPTHSLLLYLLVSFILSLTVVIVKASEAYGLGSVLGFSGSMLVRLWPFILSLLVSAGGLFGVKRYPERMLKFARRLFRGVASFGQFNWILTLLPIFFFSMTILTGWEFSFFKDFPRIWVFGHLALLGALFLSGTRRINPIFSLLVSFSLYGMLLWVVYFIPDVHSYPLSLGWSETSRYYYASLFFSPLIYGQWLPLSSLHPSRYLMQSLPFIFPSFPLWVHRLWQVLLWLGITLGGGIALTRRIKPKNGWVRLGLIAWFFMYCFQGPVYYHLMVMVILVLSGFNREKLWRSLIFIAIASIWAGISRVNWFPVPAMLGVTLYVLEKPQKNSTFWQYWHWPILAVVLGLVFAFGAQAGYAAISSNPPEVFTSSFNSPLYPYRLFPNEAYGPGIINLTITASFPLLVVILWRMLSRIRAWRFLRLLALFIILFALLVAGFIVSMKIGGGDNLHNMDAFLVILGVMAAYLAFNRFQTDRIVEQDTNGLPEALIMLVFLIPLVFAVDKIRIYPQLDSARAWRDIGKVQALIDKTLADDGEVLFIQQRHLITFDYIEGVALVPDYEKVFLMEMAMSGNEAYLTKFWRDLENHRFDLIVMEPIALVTRPASDVFGEENNVWVERVAKPMVESYAITLELPESEITVLTPAQAD